MQGLFGNLNNTLNNIGLSGNLGLLTSGVGMLEGKPIFEAIKDGLQTYKGLSSIDEERKRKELVQKLVSDGGFTQEEQALILASKNPASVAAQIKTQKQAAALAASKPMSNLGQLGRDLQKGLITQEDYDKAVAKLTNVTTGGPESTLGKLFSDYSKGRITKEQYDAAVKKATYITPEKETGPASTLGKLAKDYKDGLITKEQYDAGVKKSTYITPEKGSSAASTVGKIEQDFKDGIIDETTRDQAIKKAISTSDSKSFTVRTANGDTITYGGSDSSQKLTEQQGKDLGFATRLPNELMDELDKYDVELTNYGDILLDNDPTGFLRGPLQDPDYQMARTLAQEFVTPLIRKDTGAAIQAWETSLYDAMYFPKPGDSQQVIERKRQARRIAVEGLRSGLPPLLRIQVDPEFAKEFKALQNDVLPKGSELLKIDKNWAKATQIKPISNEAPSQQNQGSFSDRLNAATTVSELNDLAASPGLTPTDRDAIMKKLEELF